MYESMCRVGWEWLESLRVYIYIGVGRMKVCVIAKLTLSESKREFLHSIF